MEKKNKVGIGHTILYPQDAKKTYQFPDASGKLITSSEVDVKVDAVEIPVVADRVDPLTILRKLYIFINTVTDEYQIRFNDGSVVKGVTMVDV